MTTSASYEHITLEDSRAFDAALARGNKRHALRILHRVMGVALVDSSFSRGQGIHDAPGVEDGAPMFDMALNGIYPEDFYAGRHRDYGTGDHRMDSEAFSAVFAAAAGPNAAITVYRAVEKSGSKKILPGDWVTPVRAYAKEHAESNITGPSKIISMRVRACELFTDGNSLLEWGYHPQPERKLASLKEGFNLLETVQGRLFEQNIMFPHLDEAQKQALFESDPFQKTARVQLLFSEFAWDNQDIWRFMGGDKALKLLEESGQFEYELQSLREDAGDVKKIWSVRAKDVEEFRSIGLDVREIGGVYLFAQTAPKLTLEPLLCEYVATSSPATTNKIISQVLPKFSSSFERYNPLEVESIKRDFDFSI